MFYKTTSFSRRLHPAILRGLIRLSVTGLLSILEDHKLKSDRIWKYLYQRTLTIPAGYFLSGLCSFLMPFFEPLFTEGKLLIFSSHGSDILIFCRNLFAEAIKSGFSVESLRLILEWFIYLPVRPLFLDILLIAINCIIILIWKNN